MASGVGATDEENDLFTGSTCCEDGDVGNCEGDVEGQSLRFPLLSQFLGAHLSKAPSRDGVVSTSSVATASTRPEEKLSPNSCVVGGDSVSIKDGRNRDSSGGGPPIAPEGAGGIGAAAVARSAGGFEVRRTGTAGSGARGGEVKASKKPTVGRWVRKPKIKPRDYVLYWIDTKYDVLPEALRAHCEDWQEAVGPDEDVDLLWSDGAISVDRFAKMKPYQKVNHFVGMTSITRKNNLGRNLLRMKRRFPEEYRFFPDTWILPTDLPDFKGQFTGKRNKTFIVKPSDGYQGKGIFLTRDFESIPVDYNSTLVVQRYIHRPYLLQGHKFDLRLYVLVTGCDPLRIFLHERGLVRLASEEYMEPKGKNLHRQMMHLTNYAINVENPNFEENVNPEDGTDGHKRSLQAVFAELQEAGVNVPAMTSEIEELVTKTLVAVQPSLSHVYHCCQPDDVANAMCFEILGFDVLIDSDAKPWLIEVNHAPSFRTDTELDHMVKFDVLRDAFELLNINLEARERYINDQQRGLEDRARGVAVERRSPEERAALEEFYAKARGELEASVTSNGRNGYRRIYPRRNAAEGVAAVPSQTVEVAGEPQQPIAMDQYERFREAAVDIWEMLTGSRHSRKKEQQQTEGTSKSGSAGGQGAGGAAGGSRRASADRTVTRKPVDRSRSITAGSSCGGGLSSPATTTSDGGAAPQTQDPCPARGAAPPAQDGASSRSRSAEKLATVLSSAAAAPCSGLGPPKRNMDLDIGDVISVLTNMGWEAVIVRRKYDLGHLDIEFDDGESMREVMPRIQRHANGVIAVSRPGSNSRAATSGSNHGSAATTDATVSNSGPDRDGDSSTADGNGSVAFSSAQRVKKFLGESIAGMPGSAIVPDSSMTNERAGMIHPSSSDLRRRPADDARNIGKVSSHRRGGSKGLPSARRSWVPARLPAARLPEPESRRAPLAIEVRGLHPLATSLGGVG